MSVKNARNAIIIDNIKSETIEQAIIILKNYDGLASKKDIIEEANEIITKYVRQLEAGGYRRVQKKKRWFGKDK